MSALEQRVARAELSGIGVKDKDEQDFVFGAAQRLGITPLEAAVDPIVTGKLEKMRERKATKEATPAPTRGGGSRKPPKNAWDMTDEEFRKEKTRVLSGRS